MFLSFNLTTLIIINALAYFLTIPSGMPQWYFYLAEGIIIFLNILNIIVLIKKGEWGFLFFFLVVTMTLKPFYLFSNIIVDDFIPMIGITKALLLFIMSLSIDRPKTK